jgi:plasmid stability protein
MGQLLVRDLEESLVLKLKHRAASQGVSAEELHRRILREALSRPEPGKPSLIEFLSSAEGEVAPGIELEWERPRDSESRDLDLS